MGIGSFLLSVVMVMVAAGDAGIVRGKVLPKNGVWLETLDLGLMNQGWKGPQAGKSVIGMPLTLDGVEYPHGIGTYAPSEFLVDLGGGAVRFLSMVGVDDETRGGGSVVFEAWVDGKRVVDTGVMRGGDRARLLEVNLAGATQLLLLVSDGGDGNRQDHADWAGAVILRAAGAVEEPRSVALGAEPAPRIASGYTAGPAIHGARVVGATPGRPFLFLVPATGAGPLWFSAEDLPEGLALDARTGIISGALAEAGVAEVRLCVRGAAGVATRALTIVGGEGKVALTPPMGWNSWNVWGVAVDDAKVRAAADALVGSGLAAHGYQYVNIDDTWEGDRDGDGAILANKKFPDMGGLGDYVHGKGLKFGIYSSPGPKTCAGYTGSFGHERQDASRYAQWGVDFLKYDWCSYREIAKGSTLEELQKPYVDMRAALDGCGRDVVYSVCQYGMGEVWKWGADVGANLWRTTGDITDTWASVSGIGFGQDGKERYAGPGHWNDPDMLVLGTVGWGPEVRPSGLGPNEQIAHFTLWCLLAAPLLLGCDLAKLDAFTLDMLTNDEAIAVNQDPLGKQASRRAKTAWTEVWAKPMADGSLAVGLFNRGPVRTEVTGHWPDLGLQGRRAVRDLWLQKELEGAEGAVTVPVPGRGAALLRIGGK